jgi:hypothetical protein
MIYKDGSKYEGQWKANQVFRIILILVRLAYLANFKKSLFYFSVMAKVFYIILEVH